MSSGHKQNDSGESAEHNRNDLDGNGEREPNEPDGKGKRKQDDSVGKDGFEANSFSGTGKQTQSNSADAESKIFRPFLHGLASVVLIFLVSLLAAKVFNTSFLYRFGTPSILIAILFVIVGVIVGIRHLREKLGWWYLIPILYLVAAMAFLWLVGKSCPDCPFQGKTDAEIIVKTIAAEGTAVVDEDIALIQQIFAEDAVITDASTKEVWTRDDRYSTLFKNTDFGWARQYEFQPDPSRPTGDLKVFTTGSRGRYWNSGTGSWLDYDNEPGSNKWTLTKNDCGCWVIVEFTFNLPKGD